MNLARGVQPEMLGYEKRKNTCTRFKNFELNFGAYPGLIERHKKRFLILDNFFAEFNLEIADRTT